MNRSSVIATLRTKQNGQCCYCSVGLVRHRGLNPPANAETIEHLRRRADGGTNRRDNLALACRECNHGRGSIDWLTYKSLKSGELELVA